MQLEFEWDEGKNKINQRIHGLRFEYAARVFLDLHRLDQEDSRQDYGEDRRVTIGRIDERVLVVAYTERDEVTRLISARNADEKDRQDYFDQF